MAKRVAERLLDRLRGMGLNIPAGARVLDAYGDDWAFSVITREHGDLKIGSVHSPTYLMSQARLIAQRPSWGGLTRIEVYRHPYTDDQRSRFGLLLIETEPGSDPAGEGDTHGNQDRPDTSDATDA